MLTLFTTAKSFAGEAGYRQRLAIKTWKRIAPDIDIILIGKEMGAAEAAGQFGIRYQSYVKRNRDGLPLLSDLFMVAEHLAQFNILCYVNADVFILEGMAEAVKQTAQFFEGQFLMVAQRRDVPEGSCVSESAKWHEHLVKVARGGKPYIARSSDIFVFRKGIWEMLDLAVGCPGWDNWMMWKAAQEGIPIVDMTPVVLIAHPQHGYGENEMVPRKPFWKRTKYQYNKDMLKRVGCLEFGLLEACHMNLLWRVEAGGLRRVSKGDYDGLYHNG